MYSYICTVVCIWNAQLIDNVAQELCIYVFGDIYWIVIDQVSFHTMIRFWIIIVRFSFVFLAFVSIEGQADV